MFETDNYTAEVWQHIIDTFEADNPGIKIEKVLMTGDSRPQILKTMLAAGNMPDINIDPVDLAITDGVYAEVSEELLENYILADFLGEGIFAGEGFDSLIQIKKEGDAYPFGFANGHTMRNSETTGLLLFQNQEVQEDQNSDVFRQRQPFFTHF